MSETIAKRWRLLSGDQNWKDLLDPLDLDLRKYIIHYGEMSQAAYDNFNSERLSKFGGDSIHTKKNLFAAVGLEKGNPYKYAATKYLYATSQIKVPEAFIVKSLAWDAWNKESNWIGYVAVATDEGKAVLGRRDIVVAWRGTIQAIEWINDFDFPLVSASKIFGEAGDVHVQSGWLSIYTSTNSLSPYNKISARKQVVTEVQRLVEKYKDEEISITIAGHSLGAALGTLTAADIVQNGFNKLKDQSKKPCPVTGFLFGSPHVGDTNFRDLLHSMEDLHLLRVRNIPDVIPLYPPMGYADVGEELTINTLDSKYLKMGKDVLVMHDLEVYLHGVAGTQGSNGGFNLEVKRDIKLVNKRKNVLKEEYLVPIHWWCLKNKGMVQMDDGSWRMEDHERDEDEDEDEE